MKHTWSLFSTVLQSNDLSWILEPLRLQNVSNKLRCSDLEETYCIYYRVVFGFLEQQVFIIEMEGHAYFQSLIRFFLCKVYVDDVRLSNERQNYIFRKTNPRTIKIPSGIQLSLKISDIQIFFCISLRAAMQVLRGGSW